jgi:hypothetical protein
MIVQLWAEGLAPGWDGLYRADGSARAVELSGGARLDGFEFGPPLTWTSCWARTPTT